MEELFKQSINFAQIKLYKNYSEIKQRYNYVITADALPKNTPKFWVVSAEPTNTIKLYQKDRHHFFYTYNLNDIGYPGYFDVIKLENVTSNGKDIIFETTKDRHIKRHYNNPFAAITIHRIERWIKKDGDKITIKLYENTRTRGVNKIYFTKKTHSTTITFNLSNGNFRIIEYIKNKKTKQKKFYTNSIFMLKGAIAKMGNIENKISKSTPIFEEFTKEFDNSLFYFVIKNTLNFDERCVDGNIVINFIKLWIQKFIELKKIKMPNDNSETLITFFYPTEKYLKKNDRKLIASILDYFGVKSKITIKLLHNVPPNVIMPMVMLCRLMGNDFSKYIGNISSDSFCALAQDYRVDVGTKHRLNDIEQYNLCGTEKENIVKIINNFTNFSSQYTNGIIDMFYDHFRMLEKVKEYYPETKLCSTTYETFKHEHIELSKIEQAINNGWSIEYLFDNNVIQEIEKPIEITELNEPPIMYLPNIRDRIEYNKKYDNLPVSATRRVFTPKILRTSEDYLEEGIYMHHCVGGYIDQESSIIISLRHEKDRVTCEFDVKSRRCLQSRYFTNDPPPIYYHNAIEQLKNRVSSYRGRIVPLEKLKKRLEINGKPVIMEEMAGAFLGDGNPEMINNRMIFNENMF